MTIPCVKESAEIICILNVYNRFSNFEEQLNSILNQTIPAKRVIIWNNNPDVNLSSFAKKDSIIVINSSQNLGVWPRFFSSYYLFSGEYVCVFDDDTIPGNNWFKNCINTINTHNALLGTRGLIFNTGDHYLNFAADVGWHGPSDHAKVVDIVGHSWFFRKEWITTIIKELPNIDVKYFICGEDMHLSYVLQKYLNIPTIVPPHPQSDKSLWGSTYEKGMQYGTDSAAISLMPGIYDKFIIMFKDYINRGYETINNKAYIYKTYSTCLDYFINRIKSKQNFAIMKCADGEYLVSKNETLTNCDNWTFKKDSILNKHFNDSLNLMQTNVFYGVSGPTDSEEICNYWYKNIPNTHNITFANVFVNTNFEKWENFIKKSEDNCVLISQVCPESRKLGGMNIIDYLSIDKYLVNSWDIEYQKYFDLISKLAKKYTNTLFFISAGPLANIFVHRMYLENPNNTYIDSGSSIDVFTKGVITRPYQCDKNIYNIPIKNLPVVYNDLKKSIINTTYSIDVNIQNFFENIYQNNTWHIGQTESKSGLGSILSFTENIRIKLIEIIKEKNINNMLDTSCGDWNWMKMIKDDLCNYTGLDVVKYLINNHNKTFSNDKIRFIHSDFLTFIKNQPDKSFDLILCRHTLEHLPTSYNIEFLIECKRVSRYLLVTNYNNINKRNCELITDYRPVNLKLEPYVDLLKDSYDREIYDGFSSAYNPECYINLYNFKDNMI
jgi:2-polyprenyl-3-methyl-5-hydroxy-6-metoxy-1,4-benzoquinol methylase